MCELNKSHLFYCKCFSSYSFQKLAAARPATGRFLGTLNNAAQASCIAKVLSASQKYMRNQKVIFTDIGNSGYQG
jgi:hypothetical protein